MYPTIYNLSVIHRYFGQYSFLILANRDRFIKYLASISHKSEQWDMATVWLIPHRGTLRRKWALFSVLLCLLCSLIMFLYHFQDLMTEEIINFKPVTFGKMLCNLSGKSNGSILKWDIMSRWIDGIVCKYTRTMYRAKLSWRTDSSIIQSPICPH